MWDGCLQAYGYFGGRVRELTPDGFPLLCVAGASQLRELGRGAGEVRGEQKRATELLCRAGAQ